MAVPTDTEGERPEVGPTDPGGTMAEGPVASQDSGPGVDPDGTPGGVAPTRTSGVWTAAVGATALLLVLAIFVGQNTQRAEISFLAWHGRAPIAVLLLVACVAGAGLVAAVGAARILQLRPRGRAAPAGQPPATVPASDPRHSPP